MLFKRKDSFFLDLGGNEQTGAGSPPVQPPIAATSASPAEAPAPAAPSSPQPAASAPAPAPAPSTTTPQLTTAEAIAAELRADQEARPAAATVTFAPDGLNPANAVPRRRRRPGANLAGFKAMATEMFRS
jgi:hypothetical protein